MIGLVGCCKTKLDHAAPARELYTSPLFRMSLEYAQQWCTSVYVASALHDLLELDRVLAPYSRSMASLSTFQRSMFGAAVARGVVDRHGKNGLKLLVLAGTLYVDPIRAAFARMGLEVSINDPLRGLQLGSRLSFLSRALGASRPATGLVSTSAPGPTTGGAVNAERDAAGASPAIPSSVASRSGLAGNK